MAIKHVHGEFFSPEHSSDHAAFGFHGSLPTAAEPDVRQDFPPTRGMKHRAEPTESGEQSPGDYAHGGTVHPHHHPHGHEVARVEHRDGMKIEHHAHGGMTCHHDGGEVTHHHHDGSPVHHHMAEGGSTHMHPHGHHVTHVEHRAHDGAVVHHHAHGGHSVHHADGRVTHHHEDGSPVHSAHHGGHMHDSEGEYAHGRHHQDRMARGGHMGDMAEDKAMVKKAIGQHEDHEHHGEHTDLHLRRGGGIGETARLPRGMRPAMAHMHSPINTPPRKPQITRTPTNAMPGGEMGYGTQPSVEDGYEDTGATPPGMRHGGAARKRGRE